jgi:hypothetical protein
MLRKPDSISPADTVIEDPAMKPFFIVKSSTGGYVVYERVLKGEKNTEYIKTHGYPSNFNNALRMVSRELLNQSNSRHYSSIKEYIETFERLEKQMRTLTAID